MFITLSDITAIASSDSVLTAGTTVTLSNTALLINQDIGNVPGLTFIRNVIVNSINAQLVKASTRLQRTLVSGVRAN